MAKRKEKKDRSVNKKKMWELFNLVLGRVGGKFEIRRTTKNVVVVRFFYEGFGGDNFFPKVKQNIFWSTLYNQERFLIFRMSKKKDHSVFHYEFKIKKNMR